MYVRYSGLICWLVAAAAGALLFQSINSGVRHDPTLLELLLALATFLPASVGAAMILVGRALFEPMPPPVGRCGCPMCRAARDQSPT